jgi:hypothetical protein
MQYAKLSHLDDDQFRRLTGVKRATFGKMLGILEVAHAKKKARGGRPNAAPVQDMLLMALEYLREYRTYFHVGTNYGLSESAAYTTIRWVEDTLVRDGTFSLPGRKELLKSDTDIEVVLIDATESPVQRPKKNSAGITRARKSGTR